ncbi:hypothetical protein PGTUg99_023390 [Puccinia graminis f. sp. tritici]|uniref:Nucleoside diphosphate kinase n=1 Tax=Puccinia graminis f. sp. tritici TaxID=56615 RepID=A0A5B0MZ84_PUCGR|nr:hypothetical protein PGTUg99_023390 [Puccinia graminis f. sp. tritici]
MPLLLNLKLHTRWSNRHEKKNKKEQQQQQQQQQQENNHNTNDTPTQLIPFPSNNNQSTHGTPPILSPSSTDSTYDISSNHSLLTPATNSFGSITHNHPINPESPSPLPAELTIAIIHPTQSKPEQNIQATIESRLASTGFKILDQKSVHLQSAPSHLSENSLSGLTPLPATNLIYLLSRSRAIQAWKDLVGIQLTDLPARPGSLRFIFGTKAVWAADKPETVFELIHFFWPNSIHLDHPRFTHLKQQPQLQYHHHQPIIISPLSQQNTNNDTTRAPKRVFKFSRCTPQPSRQAEPSVHHSHKACVAQDELQEEEEDEEDEAEDQEEFEEQEEGDDEYDDDQPDQALLTTNQDRQLKRITQIPRHTHLSTSSHTPSLISNDSTGFSSTVNQESVIQSSSSFEAHHKQHLSETSTPLSTLQPPPNHLFDSHSSSHSSLSSTLASSPADSNMPTNNRRTSNDNSPPRSTVDSVGSTKTESPAANKMQDSGGSYTFRARPIPSSVTEPIPTPKMSKAAMLRLGLTWTPPVRPAPGSQSSTTTNSATSTRAPVPPVASLNPPAVVPRATKASNLRTNGDQPVPASSQPPRLKKTHSQIFENTPGHGFRRANLQTNIASIAQPKTQPRPTKASALRTGTNLPDQPGSPPAAHSSSVANHNYPQNGNVNGAKATGKGVRQSVDYFQGVPGHKRQEKIQVEATRRPEFEPRMTKAAKLRMAGGAATPSPTSTTTTTTEARSKATRSKRSHTSSDADPKAHRLDQDDNVSEGLVTQDSTDLSLSLSHPSSSTAPIQLSSKLQGNPSPQSNGDDDLNQRFGSVLIHHKLS